MTEDNDLIAAMIESGQGAITGRARTWLNSQVAQALTTAQAEAEALRGEVERLRGVLADLLSEGVRAIETLTAENETLRAENARLREELRQIYVDTIEQFGDWRNLPPANDEASNFVFDIARHARRALKGGEND